MKDLGTVPVMAYALENLVAFYPDGDLVAALSLGGRTGERAKERAERGAKRRMARCRPGLLEIANSLGIDKSFCPVRALLGAFVAGNRFPLPGLLDVQRRGDLRRFFGDRPAAGVARVSDPVVGDSAPPAAGTRRRSGRAPRQPVDGRGQRGKTGPVPGTGRASGRGKIGARPRPAGLGIVRPAAARRPAARRRHRAGQPGPSPAGRIAGTLLHGRSLPPAGAGTADCRDAGNPFLFRSK